MDGDIIRRLQAAANQSGVAIVSSFICLPATGQRLVNRGFMITPHSVYPNREELEGGPNLPSLQGGDGGRLFVQDKRHLYAHGGEDLFFQPAQERHIFEYKGVKILLLICYDLRFPVWARNRSGHDYDIIIVVANWPDIRIQYWDALIAARATENQCYIAAVNCVGDDGMDLHYNGHSIAYDTRLQPIVSFADDEEGTKIAEFDIDKLHHFREVLPLWKDVDHFELKK
jgi:predicted amidohydrolase